MKRHALFVGVDRYADPTIQNLAFPTKDATDLAGAFEWSLKFDRVDKLVNPDHADDILDAVRDMSRGLGQGDLFLFFFAGHGFRVKDNHVLVCGEDRYDDLKDEDAGLRIGRLKKRMAGPWSRMLVLDACQNDIRATRGVDAGATARDLELIHTSLSGGGSGCQIVVTSCSEGQRALEVSDLGHGLFTSALLASVKSLADARRRIDLETLRSDLGDRMGRLIDRYRLSGEQVPLFTMPPSAADIVLLDGVAPMAAPPPSPGPGAAPALVICPVCGRKNHPKDTFRCSECGRDNLCIRHRDEDSFRCIYCEQQNRDAMEQAKRSRPPGTVRPVMVAGVVFKLRWIPKLRSGFWMGETPVTQRLWTSVMGSNPSFFPSDDLCPVEQVSWNDCRIFLAKFNRLPEVAASGLTYRLPSEGEWTVACRAGAQKKYCMASDGTEITEQTLGRVAWFDGNSEGKTHPVAQKAPNAWGLYDMHGNVWEWTETAYVRFRGSSSCIYCGGGWNSPAWLCETSLERFNTISLRFPFVGFRLCASADSVRVP